MHSSRIGAVHFAQGLALNETAPETVKKPRRKCPGQSSGGVCAGGKKPTARSINRILKLFESFKIRTAGRKYFFDTLCGAEIHISAPLRAQWRRAPIRPVPLSLPQFLAEHFHPLAGR